MRTYNDFNKLVQKRFWKKVDTEYIWICGCWLWTGYLTDGYGKFKIKPGKQVQAHRYSYELFFGKIPNGLTLDHLCQDRSCVNPIHLEPVTKKENILRGIGWGAKNARKKFCDVGHEFTKENTYIMKSGSRFCRECGRRRKREYKRRIKNAKL